MGKRQREQTEGRRNRSKTKKFKHQGNPELEEFIGEFKTVGEKGGRHAARRAKNRAIRKDTKLIDSNKRKWIKAEEKRHREEEKNKEQEESCQLGESGEEDKDESDKAIQTILQTSGSKIVKPQDEDQSDGVEDSEEHTEGEDNSDDLGEEIEESTVEQEGSSKLLFSDSEEEEDLKNASHGKSFLDETGLAGSDEEEMESFDEDEGFDSDNEDDLVRKSKLLERQKKRVMMESEKEMQEQVNKIAVDVPRLKAVKKELKTAPDMTTILARIQDTVFILNDYMNRRRGSVRKEEYLEILKQDLLVYYSYNPYLLKKFMDFFPLNELLEFLEANELQRPLTIRTNTLKTRRKALAQALINQGINLDAVPWSKVGLVIYSTGKATVGASPEYMAGHYIIQGASSFLPVVALAPKEGEKVLDMCAAPGGKATHIAAMQRNTGMLFANDINKDRSKGLVANIHRMGVLNAVVSCMNGIHFAKRMPNFFDRVLVDAPCTGTGVISKDPSVKISKTEKDLIKCSTLQKLLLLSAIDSTNPVSTSGGFICYSTCSILVEENEEVVNYALKHRDVQLVSPDLEIGKEGFVKFKTKVYHKDMNLCRRIYPHTNNMDGFFVAKFKKLSSKILTPSKVKVTSEIQKEGKELKELVETLMAGPVLDKKTLKKQRRKAQKEHYRTLKKMQAAQESSTMMTTLNDAVHTSPGKENSDDGNREEAEKNYLENST